jgi:hypothetical protein
VIFQASRRADRSGSCVVRARPEDSRIPKRWHDAANSAASSFAWRATEERFGGHPCCGRRPSDWRRRSGTQFGTGAG